MVLIEENILRKWEWIANELEKLGVSPYIVSLARTIDLYEVEKYGSDCFTEKWIEDYPELNRKLLMKIIDNGNYDYPCMNVESCVECELGSDLGICTLGDSLYDIFVSLLDKEIGFYIPRKWEYIVELLQSVNRNNILDSMIVYAKRIDETMKKEYGDEHTQYWIDSYRSGRYEIENRTIREVLNVVKDIASKTNYCTACMDMMTEYGIANCDPCVIKHMNGQCTVEDSDYAKFLRRVNYIMEEFGNEVDS